MSNQPQRLIGILLIFLLIAVGVFFLIQTRNESLNDDDEENGTVEAVTIGIVNPTPALNAVYTSFKAQMAEMGYIEGENITYLTLDDPAMLGEHVQLLIDQDVDLILSMTTPATQAVAEMTAGTDIPVVFIPVTDPVGAGVVTDLNQPGGNITGVTFGEADAPRLQWLLTIAPTVEQIYVPYNSNDDSAVRAFETVSETAADLNVELIPQPVENPDELDALIDDIPAEADAVFLLPDRMLMDRVDEWIAVTLARDLPLSVNSDAAVREGALISYTFSFEPAGAQAARLANQILKGSNPGDLPVENAELYLVINTATASEIGLEIPPEVLAQADTLIRE